MVLDVKKEANSKELKDGKTSNNWGHNNEKPTVHSEVLRINKKLKCKIKSKC